MPALASMPIEPVPSSLAKVYPARGPIQQFQFADTSSFVCFRCEQAKKSKLIAVYSQDWSKRLCNGCYRHLLSIYKVKAGAQTDDARAESNHTACRGFCRYKARGATDISGLRTTGKIS